MTGAGLDIIAFHETSATASYNIPVIISFYSYFYNHCDNRS